MQIIVNVYIEANKLIYTTKKNPITQEILYNFTNGYNFTKKFITTE